MSQDDRRFSDRRCGNGKRHKSSFVTEDDIPRLISWWRRVLNLRSWRIDYEIVEDTTLPRALMEVTPTRLRHIAKIKIRKALLDSELPSSDFQKLLVHELCHLLTDSISEEHSLQMAFTDDEVRKKENRERFLREIEKTVEATAMILTKALPKHQEILEELNTQLYRFIGDEEITDVPRLFIDLNETSADAIVVVTLDGRIASWNPAAEELFEWTKDEVIGRPISLIVPAGEVTPVDRWNNLDNTQEIVSSIVNRRTKSNAVLVTAAKLFPIFSYDDRCIGLCCIMREVTGLKGRREQEIAQEVIVAA